MNPRKTRREVKSGPAPHPAADGWLSTALVLSVLAVYARTAGFEFVTYDDPDYVTANLHVQAGLSWQGLAWAFQSSATGNWLPLTWISHMLDCTLFGVSAGPHHLTSVLVHALTTASLFVFLRQMTGARWRSFLVAFLFGLHPLHVESVAWIAERKDVLCALFWVLTLWAYVRYCSAPNRGRYILTIALYCLALMAKPMAVSLPLILLLLDWKPLDRGIRLGEKIPFFAAAAAVSLTAWVVHQSAGAAAGLDLLPLSLRVQNAALSCMMYLWNMLWPQGLAVFYPYQPGSLEPWAGIAAIALIAITAFAVRARKRSPYVTLGWFWYLTTLIPVIGLVQVGAQARADRYTYIPLIGIAMLAVWGIGDVLAGRPRLAASFAAVTCAACLILTSIQLGYWRDSAVLYRRAIQVTSGNYLAHVNLASVLGSAGDTSGAVSELRETVRIRPYYAIAHAELGQLLASQQQPEEAVRELETAVRLKPNDADIHFRLGAVLASAGRSAEAVGEFQRSIQLDPSNPAAHFNLALARGAGGDIAGAEREFREAVRLRPDDVDARLNFGIALIRLGRTSEAIENFSEALRLKPDSAEARQLLERAQALK